MKRILFLLATVLLGFLLGFFWDRYLSGPPAQPSLSAVSGPKIQNVPSPPAATALPGFSAVVEAVRPAVVHLVSAQETFPLHLPPARDPQGRPGRRNGGDHDQSTGSGVIVSPDGVIVTNYHVIRGGERIRALLQDRREFDGVVVGVDPRTDLAVVKIDGDNLPAVQWGDSDRLNVGEYVLAMGSPFGLQSTVTMGIVSATGRTGMGITDYEDFIQTDAAINPGNSGGALVNTRGELVGINTAIISEHGGYQGIGFAVPSNLCRNVVQQLLATGAVRRGWLGLAVQDVDSSLALKLGIGEVRGALISEIDAGGPMAGSGLVPGDVIVSYDGHDVVGTADFRNRVASSPVGEEVDGTAIRDGQVVRFRVKVGEQREDRAVKRPERSGEPYARSTGEGLEVRNLTPGTVKQLDLPPDVRGVLVSRVDKGGAAWRAGLRRGDVILAVNKKPVDSVKEYSRVTEESGRSVLLYVRRSGQSFFILVEGEAPPG